jgi:hypothetical protein
MIEKPTKMPRPEEPTMADTNTSSFWADFMTGLAGPAAAARATREVAEEAQDRFDTLRNLQEGEFIFNQQHKRVVEQLDFLFQQGFFSAPPNVLRNEADIGHGKFVTDEGRKFLQKFKEFIR